MEKAVTDFLHYCRLQRRWSGGWRRSPRWNGKVKRFIRTLLREWAEEIERDSDRTLLAALKGAFDQGAGSR